MTVIDNRLSGHRHPTPDHVATLPPPVEQIGAAARENVHCLLCALAADCERCLQARIRRLIQEQQINAPAPQVTREAGTSSMVLGDPPRQPGPAEAVYADLLHLLSQLLAAAADACGEDRVAFTRARNEEFINACPAGMDMLIAQTLVQTATSLVEQDCDPVVACELAQGVIPLFNMLSDDGHTQLTNLIDTCLGLVAAVAEMNTLA